MIWRVWDPVVLERAGAVAARAAAVGVNPREEFRLPAIRMFKPQPADVDTVLEAEWRGYRDKLVLSRSR